MIQSQEPSIRTAANRSSLEIQATARGRWEREILPQGNAVFINRVNGNRIVVPLR